jgi:hypothetical protein
MIATARRDTMRIRCGMTLIYMARIDGGIIHGALKNRKSIGILLSSDLTNKSKFVVIAKRYLKFKAIICPSICTDEI